MRKCIINCCEEINLIGQQINKLNSDIPDYPNVRRREWLLQQNIYHHSNRAAVVILISDNLLIKLIFQDLRLLLYSGSGVTDAPCSDKKPKEPKSRTNAIMQSLMQVLCKPIHHTPIWNHWILLLSGEIFSCL